MSKRNIIELLPLKNTCSPGPGCSKLMTLLVNVSLKFHMLIQATLVTSKLKGPSETLRDIRTSTYQMCGTEENTNRTTKFHK